MRDRTDLERTEREARDAALLDFDEIARSVGKSEANARQILTRARSRLRDPRPRFRVSRPQSEEIVRRFREACATGDVEELMSVLHSDATLIADAGGKATAPAEPLLGATRIVDFVVDIIGRQRWSAADPQLVTINGALGLLVRTPTAGDATWSFDVDDGGIRAIYVVRNPYKLRSFLERIQ